MEGWKLGLGFLNNINTNQFPKLHIFPLATI